MFTTKKALSTLWTLNTLGIHNFDLSTKEEEKLALKQFYDNIQYDEKEKRYSITWP